MAEVVATADDQVQVQASEVEAAEVVATEKDQFQACEVEASDLIILPLGPELKLMHETLVKLLLKRINKLPLNLGRTTQLHSRFYEKSPAEIFADVEFSFDDKYLVLVIRKKKGKSLTIYKRQLPGVLGSWDASGNMHAVLDSATYAPIGRRTSFRFFSGSKTPTSWRMVEYTSADHPNSELALCMVYQDKEKPPKAAQKKKEKAEKAIACAKHTAATIQLKEKAAALRHDKAKKDLKMAEARLKHLTERYEKDWSTPVSAAAAADLLEEMEGAQNGPQQGHTEPGAAAASEGAENNLQVQPPPAFHEEGSSSVSASSQEAPSLGAQKLQKLQVTRQLRRDEDDNGDVTHEWEGYPYIDP